MSDTANLTLLTHGTTRRQAVAGFAMAFGGLVLGTTKAWAAAEEEISHSADAIHQEPVFKANRRRIYDALTETKQFDKIVELSGVRQSGMLPPGADKPTYVSGDAGGPFVLFGGYITGRNIELLPNERVVQAWRAGSWGPGIYSIARFELVEQGTGTKIVFDHTGFPKGTAEALASGWKAHYWEPLEKLLT